MTPLPPLRLQPHVTPLPWQEEACQAWVQGAASAIPPREPGTGIIEAVTGTGKSITAMMCMVEAAKLMPNLKFAVVVPGRLLATQWRSDLLRTLNLSDHDVAIHGDGHKGSLKKARVVVWVINSAREHLIKDAAGLEVMLVVDECHRSASPQNKRIYLASCRFRLGLSATAQLPRETDEYGIVLPLERQTHARRLGGSCYRLTIAQAAAKGYLPPFTICHHGVSLGTPEVEEYERLTEVVIDAIAELDAQGLSPAVVPRILARRKAGWTEKQVAAAKAYLFAVLARKRFLYMRPERNRVAAVILEDAFRRVQGTAGEQELQALLFNERIAPTGRELAQAAARAEWAQAAREQDEEDAAAEDEDDDEVPFDDADAASAAVPLPPIVPLPQQGAAQLFDGLVARHRAGSLRVSGQTQQVIRVSHSGIKPDTGVADMRRPVGDPQRGRVLITVRGATEGVDLPGADLGIIVASSSSVLQRIQTLGRILRPRRDGSGRPIPVEAYLDWQRKVMHILYVKGTVDEEIYRNTDWDELLGAERNQWFTWSYEASYPTADNAPPAPPLSEAEAWAWVQQKIAEGHSYPILWPTRLPPHQTLRYKGNHVRTDVEWKDPATGEKERPIVHNDPQIRALLEAGAAAFKVGSTDVRSKCQVSIANRLLLRRKPTGAPDLFSPVEPETGRPLHPPVYVFGQLDELPRVDSRYALEETPEDDDGDTGADGDPDGDAKPPSVRAEAGGGAGAKGGAERGSRAADGAALSGEDAAAIAVLRAFIQAQGAAQVDAVAALPPTARVQAEALFRMVASGAAETPWNAPRNYSALPLPMLAVALVRAKALGDADVAASAQRALDEQWRAQQASKAVVRWMLGL